MGNVDNVLVGPHFLPDSLNSEGLLDFLENDLELLLENVTLQIRRQLWFQMDGCPAHIGKRSKTIDARIFSELLDTTCRSNFMASEKSRLHTIALFPLEHTLCYSSSHMRRE